MFLIVENDQLYGWGDIKYGKLPRKNESILIILQVNEEFDSEICEPRHIHLHPFKKTVENDSKSTHRKFVHLNEEAEG
jgi:hypothetical protein